jgi:predicted transcriptional regulator
MGARMDRSDIFETIAVMLLILLGCALFVSVSAGPSGRGGNWSTSSVNATPFMYAGSDDWLYMFDVLQDGTNICAVDPDGRLAWFYEVPGTVRVVNCWERKMSVTRYGINNGQIYSESDIRPVFAVDNGTMYLYVMNGGMGVENPDAAEEVIALSRGRIIWERTLAGNGLIPLFRDASIQVYGDRLYVYHSYSLDVLGVNGTPLYTITDVSDPPALDEKGNLYLSKTGKSPDAELNQWAFGSGSVDYLTPSGTIESRSPDGTLRWKTDINDTPARQDIDRTAVPQGGDLPLFHGGQLYVPLKHGLVTLDLDGKVLWTASIDDNVSMLTTMPFGPDGIVYMARDNNYDHRANQTPAVYTVIPGGAFTIALPSAADMELLVASQSIGYYGHSWFDEDDLSGIDNLLPVNITAVDLRTGDALWECELAPPERETVVASEKNIGRLFEYSQTAYNSIAYTEDHPDLVGKAGLMLAILGNSRVNVFAAGDTIYVSYYLYNYEHPEGFWTGTTYTRLFVFSGSENSAYICPALIGRSRICYASGVAALDRDGKVLWNRPLDSMLTGMAAGNVTVYYGTRDGGLSAVRTNVAVGFTLTAALYLFFRFFMVGAVSRARSRINDNENRNRVLKLIKAQPGNTMYDIARLLGMNAGTVRYHLLILGLNHRIVTFRDRKYVRYFGNANAYTEEDRAIMSLLRRDRARGLLAALLERDRMSNVELAHALGVTEPAVSGYMRELAGKGIVIRDVTPGGSVLYSIRGDYKEKVANVLNNYPAT